MFSVKQTSTHLALTLALLAVVLGLGTTPASAAAPVPGDKICVHQFGMDWTYTYSAGGFF
ncbi:MAG: hypothetical protein FJ011_19705 [Chloroflexi bacterium]|nr:hypothetical protein [Chloroflexota bacterium]